MQEDGFQEMLDDCDLDHAVLDDRIDELEQSEDDCGSSLPSSDLDALCGRSR